MWPLSRFYVVLLSRAHVLLAMIIALNISTRVFYEVLVVGHLFIKIVSSTEIMPFGVYNT